MSTAVKKMKVVIPTPAERGEVLLSEIAELSLHERIDALRPLVAALQPLLDRTLDELAEERCPRGELKEDAHGRLVEGVGALPAAFVRQAMGIRGGHDLLNTFLEATKS
jgi:hypothetical protein